MLHNDDDTQTVATVDSELERFNTTTLSDINNTETISSGKNEVLGLYLHRNKLYVTDKQSKYVEVIEKVRVI